MKKVEDVAEELVKGLESGEIVLEKPALSDLDLDSLIAEKMMNWKIVPVAEASPHKVGTLWLNPTGSCLLGYLSDLWSSARPWSPSTNRINVAQVIQRIEDLRLQTDFVERLKEIVFEDIRNSNGPRSLGTFALIHANPRHLAEACWQTWEQANPEKTK